MWVALVVPKHNFRVSKKWHEKNRRCKMGQGYCIRCLHSLDGGRNKKSIVFCFRLGFPCFHLLTRCFFNSFSIVTVGWTLFPFILYCYKIAGSSIHRTIGKASALLLPLSRVLAFLVRGAPCIAAVLQSWPWVAQPSVGCRHCSFNSAVEIGCYFSHSPSTLL